MTFLYHRVQQPLSGKINFLYATHGKMPFRRGRIFPTASTDLKINLGAPWLVDDLARGGVRAQQSGWCMGIWDHHHIVGWPAQTDFVAVSFKPGGAHAFLGVPMAELRNQIVSLDAIWGSAFEAIRQQLGEAQTVERRFALLEAFLLERWQESNEAAALAGRVAADIRNSNGKARIGNLSDEAGISHKHLITLFNRVIGCRPKELARLARFHHAIDGVDVAAPVRWTDVAYEHAFADQAHFTREFAAYSGLTPTEYLVRRRAIHAERPAHASVPWVLPAGYNGKHAIVDAAEGHPDRPRRHNIAGSDAIWPGRGDARDAKVRKFERWN